MLYNRKLIREVVNRLDMDLAFTEYKVSVYGEISNYLADNNCADGVNLVNKAKQEMDNYVKNLKNDLVEIENICAEISIIIKKMYTEKKDIPSMITIYNKDIFISRTEKQYGFIYAIGFDEHKKIYKYGIIEGDINKGKFYKSKNIIGFSEDSELTRYANFKTYFIDLISDFNNTKSIEELEYLKTSIDNELLGLFYTEDLRTYLACKSELIKKLTGISGLDILRKLYQSYDINRVRIKLSLSGYSVDNSQLVKLVRAELSSRRALDEINKLVDIEDEEIKESYTELANEKSKEVEFLKRELNMSSSELEIAISKVNSEF